MFDLLIQGTSAFNQAILILAGLICVGLGAVLLGHEIYWRLRALRVQGTIVGVREKGKGMFHSVYRYSLPSGESVEATSTEGSSSTRGRETGKPVELLLFANKPDDVSEARSVIAEVVGAVFILAGLWPLHTALTAWPVTPMTWAMLVVVCVYAASRIRRHIIPKSQRLSVPDWQRARQEKHRAELAAAPVRPMEEVLSSPAVVEQQRRAQISARIVTPILLIVGAALLAFGVYWGRNVAELQAAGTRVEGTVVNLRADSGTHGSTYHAIVRFTALNNVQVEFTDKVGTDPPSFHAGERVVVLYRTDEPQSTAMIDRGRWNLLGPALLCAFGGLCFFVSARSLARART